MNRRVQVKARDIFPASAACQGILTAQIAAIRREVNPPLVLDTDRPFITVVTGFNPDVALRLAPLYRQGMRPGANSGAG